MDAHGLHLLLLTFICTMYFLVLAYLRGRRISFGAFAFWGLVAMLLPAFGPFFVIAIRPGNPTARPR